MSMLKSSFLAQNLFCENFQPQLLGLLVLLYKRYQLFYVRNQLLYPRTQCFDLLRNHQLLNLEPKKILSRDGQSSHNCKIQP